MCLVRHICLLVFILQAAFGQLRIFYLIISKTEHVMSLAE